MTVQPVEVPLDLSGNYVDQVNAAAQATDTLQTAVTGLQMRTSGVQRALDAVTPSRAHIAAWAGFTTAAAYFQSQVNPIKTTAVAAGASLRGLDQDVKSLARSMPIGTGGAVQYVQTVQQLGVGLGSTRGQVRGLATDLARLEAANNSMGTGLGLSFGQLNRQMASLDPQRLERFSDVLTTVSARSGASATGIVEFSRNIAPMAQQAGLGETAVLGISSAFVKLGDDGYSAATAVNKILGDLNRSVREGSNDMAAYAQIVGMTTSQFSRLYQANPQQALTRVVGAIGSAGPQGQMQLESLGLEGVRTQQALLRLSQSGGLGAAIAQAQGAYGNGSTRRAAAQAFSGLDSSLTMLRTTAGQTADALGAPFLGALTRVTDVAKAFLQPVNAVLGSGYSQSMLRGLAAVAVTGMAIRRVVRPLGNLALLGQAATSGPVRSLAGGYAVARSEGDLERAIAMRSGQFGYDAIQHGAAGLPYGRGGFMQGFNQYAGAAGARLGGVMTELRGPIVAGEGGLGLGTIARRGAMNAAMLGSMSYEAMMNSIADPAVQAMSPAGMRRSLLTPGEGGLFQRAGSIRSGVIASARAEGMGALQARAMGAAAALSLIQKEGGTYQASMARMVESTNGAAGALARFAGESALAGGRVVGGGLASLGRSAYGMAGGGLGLAMIGGLGGYELYKHWSSQNAASDTQMKNLDIYGVANSWADAVGEASKGATTMAEAMQSAADTINSSVKNFPSARTVSNADITAAQAGMHGRSAADIRKSAALSYTGSTRQVAAQISAANLNGMTPQDMQGVKMQLLQQGWSPEHVNQILSQVNTRGTGGAITGGAIASLVAGGVTGSRYYSQHRGTFDSPNYQGRDTERINAEIVGAIGQQRTNLQSRYGSAYANQATVRTINTTLREARDQGNNALVKQIAQAFGVSGKHFDTSFNPSGGPQLGFGLGSARQQTDFSGDNPLLALTGGGGHHSMAGFNIPGMTAAQVQAALSGPAMRRSLMPSIMEAPLRGAGATALLPFFTSARAPQQFRAGQRAAEYVAAGHEADIGALTKATNAMVESATKSGTSLSELAVQAGKATSATAGWQQQLMAMIMAQAQFRQQTRLQGATRAQTWQTMIGSDVATINAGPGVDPNGPQAQAYNNARNDLQQRRADIISYYQQRLQAQFQYQVQSARSAEDFQRSTGRAEQDFYRQRGRALRDFNIQRRREIQDAATQDYSVYTRIQTQPTWDAVNLLGNAREQLQAMRQQVTNIRTLKGLGLSEAALRMLDAYNPQNAQQIQQLVYDLRGNAGLVAQYDRTAAAREQAAGGLLGMSTTFQRQRQDFQRGLRDTRNDFNIAMGRQRTDYQTAMARAAQDLHNSDLEMTNDLETLQKDMNRVVNGQTVDFRHTVHDNMASALRTVQNFMPRINRSLNQGANATAGVGGGSGGKISYSGGRAGGGFGNASVSGSGYTTLPSGKRVPNPGGDTGPTFVKPGTGSVYHGSTSQGELPSQSFRQTHPAHPSFNQAIAKAMKPAWAHGDQWKAWQDLWHVESGWNQYAFNGTDPNGYGQTAYGIPQSYPGHKMGEFGRDWQTNPATQIAWGIHYIAGTYGSPLEVARRQGLYSGHYQGYDAGGIATKPHLGMVAESGSAELMLPLNQRGAQFFVDAMKQYVSSSDAAKIATGGMGSATYVTDNSRHYHDHRNDFSGAEITVKANTPREMAMQLEANARKDGLTATRGVQTGG